MAIEFTLPALGEGIKEGTIVNVLVSEGETVEENQPVLELETDKAVLEVPSEVSGTVQSVAVKTGGKIKIGDLVFTYEANNSTSSAPAPVAATPEPPAAEPATPVAAPAPASSAAPAAPSTPAPSLPAPIVHEGGAPIPAAPSVRRFAREIGVDIYEVAGSGPGGRIREDDVKHHARSLISGGVLTSNGGAPAMALPDFSKFGAIEVEPLSNVRRATSNQMARAWQAPHVTQFDKADITNIEALRKKYSKEAEKQGGKLTVTAILIKVIVAALKKYPQFNASLDLANDQIIYKQYFNIGVAVDTERGLLVPVIKNADEKGLFEIAAELGGIAERARNKKTSLDEMSGGCFTLTNLGGIGGTAFTPIINVPEVAILGVARGGFEPVWNKDKGEFAPRLMLPLSLSYDHRVIDGADGARFLRFIAEALEEPFLLTL